jgi:hypothetical protein
MHPMLAGLQPWSPPWFRAVVQVVAPGARCQLAEGDGQVFLVVRIDRSWWKRKRIEKLLRDRILDENVQPAGIGCRIEVRR